MDDKRSQIQNWFTANPLVGGLEAHKVITTFDAMRQSHQDRKFPPLTRAEELFDEIMWTAAASWNVDTRLKYKTVTIGSGSKLHYNDLVIRGLRWAIEKMQLAPHLRGSRWLNWERHLTLNTIINVSASQWKNLQFTGADDVKKLFAEAEAKKRAAQLSIKQYFLVILKPLYGYSGLKGVTESVVQCGISNGKINTTDGDVDFWDPTVTGANGTNNDWFALELCRLMFASMKPSQL